MKKEKVLYFERILKKQLEDLRSEAEKAVDGMSKEGNVFADPNDRAAFEGDRFSILRIKDRERKLINKIEKALEKIKDGSFGICEKCGEEISEKRLEARPVATLCIRCKEEEELREKREGL